MIRLIRDLAYQSFRLCLVPFIGRRTLNASQRRQNEALSSIRISIKNFFSLIIEQQKYLSYKIALQVSQSPITSYFKVGVLLSNYYICLYSNTVRSRFSIDAPLVEEYLQVSQYAVDQLVRLISLNLSISLYGELLERSKRRALRRYCLLDIRPSN